MVWLDLFFFFFLKGDLTLYHKILDLSIFGTFQNVAYERDSSIFFFSHNVIKRYFNHVCSSFKKVKCQSTSNSLLTDKVKDLTYSLQYNKFLNLSKLKAFADGKCDSKIEIFLGKGRKHCGKRRKCLLSAFSPCPSMFSKGFPLRVVKRHNCVVKN